MKLKKISLSQLSTVELNERQLSQLLGGGTPGCCQCGCHYAGSGGSSTADNDSANDASGQVSDPNQHPCCVPAQPSCNLQPQDNTCVPRPVLAYKC